MFEGLKQLYFIAGDSKTKLEFRLLTINSAIEIFYGPGMALDLDSAELNKALFSIILDLKEKASAITSDTLTRIKEIITKLFLTKRQFSYPCVANFLIILTILARNLLKERPDEAFGILEIVKLIFSKYPRSRVLLEEDDYDSFLEPKTRDPYSPEAMQSSIVPLINEIKVKAGKKNNIVGLCLSLLKSN